MRHRDRRLLAAAARHACGLELASALNRSRCADEAGRSVDDAPPRPRLSGRQGCARVVEIALDAVLRLENRLACLEVDFEHARPLERELAGHEQDRRAISLNAHEVRPHVAERVAVLFRDRRQRQAMAEIHLGLLREADASASQLDCAVGATTSGDRVEALGLRAWLDALLRDEDSCRSRIAAAEASAAELRITPSSGMAAGLLALRAGRYEEAVACLEAKLFGSSPLAATLSLRPFLDGLVEACARSGRHDRARELVAEVYEAAVATTQPRYVAIALRMRAVARGELEDFDFALEQHGLWGNRFEEARTRLLYGEALRRAKRRKEAREQLSAATSGFAAVGATAWKRRARDELRAAGAKLPQPASGFALTSQEQRVARLVADGLSNKEIAGRLVISTKTVEGHLRNIFEKLGATSRTQVARALTR